MSLASLSLCHHYMLTVICRLPISSTVSANFSKFSCILQASGHTAAGLVRHPGSVRPDEQNSVAE